MSIKIHHGAPGSYKSSGAIHTDVLPAIKAGRHIITNVRGFTAERCKDVLGNAVPDAFEVTYIETESQEGRDHLARFYHWAPKGVFFLVDEVQRVFPPSWRQSDLDRLAYPGGPDKAKQDGRPETIDVAFDMHRHHNWDFVFTTPNISKVHSVIRAPAETAIRHTNMAVLGIGGRYKTVLHLSDNSGTSASHVLQAKPFNKVPKYVFELYDSTTTGKVSDTIAGSSIFRDPKILFLLAFLSVSWFFGFIYPEYIAENKGTASLSPSSGSPSSSSSSGGSEEGALGGGVSVPDLSGSRPANPLGADFFSVGPFAGYKLILTCGVFIMSDTGAVNVQYCFSLRRDDVVLSVDPDEWPEHLADIEPRSACHARVKYAGSVVDVYCDPTMDELRRKYNSALFPADNSKSFESDDRA